MFQHFVIKQKNNQWILKFFISGSHFAKIQFRFERLVTNSWFSKPDSKTESSFVVIKHALSKPSRCLSLIWCILVECSIRLYGVGMTWLKVPSGFGPQVHQQWYHPSSGNTKRDFFRDVNIFKPASEWCFELFSSYFIYSFALPLDVLLNCVVSMQLLTKLYWPRFKNCCHHKCLQNSHKSSENYKYITNFFVHIGAGSDILWSCRLFSLLSGVLPLITWKHVRFYRNPNNISNYFL